MGQEIAVPEPPVSITPETSPLMPPMLWDGLKELLVTASSAQTLVRSTKKKIMVKEDSKKTLGEWKTKTATSYLANQGRGSAPSTSSQSLSLSLSLKPNFHQEAGQQSTVHQRSPGKMHSKLPVAYDGLYVTGIFADKRLLQTPYWLLTNLKISSVKQSHHRVAHMHATSVLNFTILTKLQFTGVSSVTSSSICKHLFPDSVTATSTTLSTVLWFTYLFFPRRHTHYTYVTMFSLLVIMLRIMTFITNSNEWL
jgi:hypothetical protein